MVYAFTEYFAAGATSNPWKMPIHYENISPWMGTKTRVGSQLLNTEYKKGAIKKASSQAKPKKCATTNVSHEDVLDALHSKNTVRLRII